MGDTHFPLRHAVVGAVFLLFAWIGWWWSAAEAAWTFLDKRTQSEGLAAISGLVLAPLIGITIQGLHIIVVHLFRGEIFHDGGRNVIAEAMRDAFSQCRGKNPAITDQMWNRLRKAPDDSLFVWLYHRSAPAELIEWARRRRSYYYLGINLVIASGGGLVSGRYAPPLLAEGGVPAALLIGAAALAWFGGATWAALIMRRDVETMELLWSVARVDRRLKHCLQEALGTVVDEESGRRTRSGPLS